MQKYASSFTINSMLAEFFPANDENTRNGKKDDRAKLD